MARNDPKPAPGEEEGKTPGRKGGGAAGAAPRKKATLRMALEALLERKDENGLSGREAVARALYEKALSGDVRALVELRDTVGEKPVQKAESRISGRLAITWQD